MDAVDAVHSGCSGIVVYGGGDIVFDTKRSNQWMQWMQYTVDAVHSGCSMQWMQWNGGIWWWGHCLWCKKVKLVDSVYAVTQWTKYTVDVVDAVYSGCSMQ